MGLDETDVIFKMATVDDLDDVTLCKKCLNTEIFWFVFPAFGLNTKSYGVALRIHSEYGKIQTRKSSIFGHFSRSFSNLNQSIWAWLILWGLSGIVILDVGPIVCIVISEELFSNLPFVNVISDVGPIDVGPSSTFLHHPGCIISSLNILLVSLCDFWKVH